MRPFHWLEGATVSISASTTNARAALARMPTGTVQIRLHNAGPSTVFVRKGVDNTVVAAVTDMPIPSGAIEVLTLNNTEVAPITHIAAITASGTATLYATTGAGI